ncbi:MAG: Nif3-like dinuclear metal center hexameric protein [Bacteriovoracia bacterium]
MAKGKPVLSRDELQKYFQTLLTPEVFDDYAPNGLQIEGKTRVIKVAFAVSATQDSIAEALAWGADTLVVHHGVFWKHQGARTLTGAWGERVMRAVRSELNLFAYHLPLDAHPEVGNAASLARELKLTQLAPFAPSKKQFLGVSGTLPAPLSARDLSTKLEAVLQHKIMTAVMDENKPIRHIGIVTGGANNEWPEALKAGLDAYLTGEMSEYNWHDAREAGIAYFAGGHHATEKFGPQALMRRLKQDHPQLEVKFFDSLNPA